MTEKTTPSIEDLQDQLTKALASIEKLTTKNSELISREKKAKDAADAAEEARETAAEDAARKANDLEALEKSLEKKYSKQIADVTAERDAGIKQLQTLLIDNGIQSELVANKVSPQFHRAVTAMLKAEAILKDGTAMIADTPLSDYVKTFLTSDEGKHFVEAPMNSGAGATGSTAKADRWAKPPVTSEEMREFAKLSNTDAAYTNSLADQWNMPHLKV